MAKAPLVLCYHQMPGHFIFKDDNIIQVERTEHQKSQMGNKIPKMPNPVRSHSTARWFFLLMAIFNLQLKTQLSLMRLLCFSVHV